MYLRAILVILHGMEHVLKYRGGMTLVNVANKLHEDVVLDGVGLGVVDS